MGMVSMRRPETVELSSFHVEVEGQQSSPGRQRQFALESRGIATPKVAKRPVRARNSLIVMASECFF